MHVTILKSVYHNCIKCVCVFQNYKDRQAETNTIILDIPGIQAKGHHIDEELRSLTLEALRVAYPSII